MKLILTTIYNAEHVTIGHILKNSQEYMYLDFVDDVYENPWPYNEDWFLSKSKSKKVYALTWEDGTAVMKKF